MTDRELFEKALEALETNQYAVADVAPHRDVMAYNDAITALRDRLAQPEQEPVAVARVDDLERGGRVRALAMNLSFDAPLYTTPPQRNPWVGLTDEERNNLWRDVIGWGDPSHDDEDLMKAIEAKLREKNT